MFEQRTFLKRIPSESLHGIWQFQSPQLLASGECLLADACHCGRNVQMFQFIAFIEVCHAQAWNTIWDVHLLQLIATEERVVWEADA